MSKYKILTERAVLEALAQHLESGQEVPPELAERAAPLVRSAASNYPEAKTAMPVGLDRANRVWAMHHTRGITKKEAQRLIAKEDGVSFDTVADNWKEYRSLLNQFPSPEDIERWQRSADELKALLLEFRHEDGSPFTESDVDIALEIIPANIVERLVDEIIYGPLRRDVSFLRGTLESLTGG